MPHTRSTHLLSSGMHIWYHIFGFLRVKWFCSPYIYSRSYINCYIQLHVKRWMTLKTSRSDQNLPQNMLLASIDTSCCWLYFTGHSLNHLFLQFRSWKDTSYHGHAIYDAIVIYNSLWQAVTVNVIILHWCSAHHTVEVISLVQKVGRSIYSSYSYT